jgi:hypothetical protein
MGHLKNFTQLKNFTKSTRAFDQILTFRIARTIKIKKYWLLIIQPVSLV